MVGVRRIMLGVTAAAMALFLVGCSGGGPDETSTGGAQPAAEGPGNAAEPAQDAEVGEGAAPVEAKAPDLRVDRALVYTGSLTLRVDDVNQAAAKATGIITAAGGFVGADRRSSGAGPSDATLEMRVPADRFAAVVDQLARDLGEVEDRSINRQDVTEETIDLDARIKTQQARVDSGRRLLAQAKTLADLVMLERELATREADLASLDAKKRRLDDLTTLSTITLTLLDPDAAAADDDDPGFLGGLAAGWTALLVSLGLLLTVLGALLPWLVVLGLPVLAAILLTRRLRRRRPAPALPPTPSPPTPAPPAPPASRPS